MDTRMEGEENLYEINVGVDRNRVGEERGF